MALCDMMADDIILLDEEDVLVVNKPSGMPVHHSREHLDADTALLQLVRDTVGTYVYTVHRLDRATSGVVVFGRTPQAAKELREAVANTLAEKWYLALTKGNMSYPVSSVRPLTKRETGVVQSAATTFWPLASVPIPGTASDCSLVRVQIYTGRRHQIRRHLNHLRHQILGDTTYGKGRINRHVRNIWRLPRLALHAERIVFPWRGRQMDIVAPLPTDLKHVLEVSGLPICVAEEAI